MEQESEFDKEYDRSYFMTIDLNNDQIFSIKDIMNNADSDQRSRIEFGESVFDSVKGIR